MIDLANEGENDAEWMCRVEPGAPRPKSSPLHKKVKISFDPGMSFVRSQTPWQFADAKFLKLFTSSQNQLWVRHIYACGGQTLSQGVVFLNSGGDVEGSVRSHSGGGQGNGRPPQWSRDPAYPSGQKSQHLTSWMQCWPDVTRNGGVIA